MGNDYYSRALQLIYIVKPYRDSGGQRGWGKIGILGLAQFLDLAFSNVGFTIGLFFTVESFWIGINFAIKI